MIFVYALFLTDVDISRWFDRHIDAQRFVTRSLAVGNTGVAKFLHTVTALLMLEQGRESLHVF